MTESETPYLDMFPQWLKSLPTDAAELAAFVKSDDAPAAAREIVAGGINYLFKSLDLIPDGIDDIGYLDDAFVLRVASRMAAEENVSSVAADLRASVNRLAEDDEHVKTFLGDNYERLSAYVEKLRTGAARGRAVTEILDDDEVMVSFQTDVESFASGYQTPTFGRDPKNLIKLKAFFDAKLPK